jgi:hypothetical protein
MWLETLEEIRELNAIKERRLSQYVLAEKSYQFAVKALSQKTDKLLKVVKELIIEEVKRLKIDSYVCVKSFRLYFCSDNGIRLELKLKEEYPIDEIRDILNFRLLTIHCDLRICQVIVD